MHNFMVYDEGLAYRISELFSDFQNVKEKKMFGGIAYVVNGKMSCGIVKEELMGRVDAREMDFAGRPMKGFIYVSTDGLEENEDLKKWVMRGYDYANSLPSK